jgi:hypothetical protein
MTDRHSPLDPADRVPAASLSDAPAARCPRAPEWLPWRVVACTIVLIGTATGLRPAMAALAERYRKEPAMLRRPLTEFAIERLPSFRQLDATGVFAVAPVTEEAVGTNQRLLRYVQDKSDQGRRGQATLFVTYYNGTRDKIPHTPDVCYRQGGVQIRSMSKIAIDTPGMGPDNPRAEGCLLDLANAPGNGVLIYLFVANGRTTASRLHARWIISRPGDRYVYFSKVEVIARVESGEDREMVISRCKKLLSEAIPVLFADHYPRTEDLRAR